MADVDRGGWFGVRDRSDFLQLLKDVIVDFKFQYIRPSRTDRLDLGFEPFRLLAIGLLICLGEGHLLVSIRSAFSDGVDGVFVGLASRGNRLVLCCPKLAFETRNQPLILSIFRLLNVLNLAAALRLGLSVFFLYLDLLLGGLPELDRLFNLLLGEASV